MNEGPTASDAARLLTHLAQARPGHHVKVESQELAPEVQMLRAFQSQRLSKTHADLLDSPRYRPAAEFFLNDVYGPRDFSQRDADIQRFYQGVHRVLPDRAVTILRDVVSLASMTNDLDERLLRALIDTVGVTGSISPQQYAEGYRVCDNYDERLQQIKLISQIGLGIDKLVQIPFIGMTLRLAHTPAVMAGWGELQHYLEHGFSAFKHMRGAAGFLNTIETRETRILDRIYAGAENPFDIGD